MDYLEYLPVALAGLAIVLRFFVVLPRDLRLAKHRAKLRAVA